MNEGTLTKIFYYYDLITSFDNIIFHHLEDSFKKNKRTINQIANVNNCNIT